MPDFGVCSSEERCGLSYQNAGLSRLRDLIKVIEERRLAGGNADQLLPRLDAYLRFFQEGIYCSECGGHLIKMTRPTADLAADNEEYRRIVRANEILDGMHRLQALGKLPV
ncbi:MAG: hypothetical protein WBZ19_20045 [Chthoniobacterales bacterium]